MAAAESPRRVNTNREHDAKTRNEYTEKTFLVHGRSNRAQTGKRGSREIKPRIPGRPPLHTSPPPPPPHAHATAATNGQKQAQVQNTIEVLPPDVKIVMVSAAIVYAFDMPV